jgi:peptidyl-tRNA hydrolase, PTH1 family
MFQLVVGVGNPGTEYATTRHNVAWMLLDYSSPFKEAQWKSKFKGVYSEISLQDKKYYALKPQTYMNLSGESARPLADFFKIPAQKILVIHDELDLPFGQVHFKMGGGLAGHNGLKSIAQCFGTDQFARMRIGIGRPLQGSVANFVLSPFSKEEQSLLPDLLEKLHQPLLACMMEGLNKVSVLNKKNLLA